MARRPFLWCLCLLVWIASPARAQAPVLSGVVVDESGAPIAGVRVSVRDARGALAGSAVTGAAGAFAIAAVTAGVYDVQVDAPLFVPASVRAVVPASGAAAALRVVLRAAGYSEHVVVTAARDPTRAADTPQTVEVIDRTDLDRTVAADLTDALKKNAGVDVIQYTRALSGIGIRGFRPQFSGINKRSLLLVDGRPSGVTNLATLRLDDVERVEVLKGAASALYGSSAMGGVVNVVTRASTGPIGGRVRLGAGSFGTTDVQARAGGAIVRRLDFDLTGSAVDERDDIRMGNGVVRPATRFHTSAASGRIGADLGGGWRANARVDVYRGRDIETPPDIAAGTIGQGRKDLDRRDEDVRLTGRMGEHALTFVAYGARESGETFNVTTSNPADAPYLPYLTFDSALRWAGGQARDAFDWGGSQRLVAGVDVERVTSVSRSYARTGERIAPFSADSRRRTVGAYVENASRLGGGRTVVTLGARVDRIGADTLATPLKTNFTPSSATFVAVNPSLGVTHELRPHVRAHATAGRAFVPADASMLTGFTTTVVGGRTQITQGNPDLKPERSVSVDGGAEWRSARTRLDATVFRTVVRDRVISNVVVRNPPPPDPIVVSVANGLDAHIRGLDVDGERQIGSRLAIFGNATHYFARNERLADGRQQPILNVARTTIRAGVDVTVARVTTRVSGRFVHGRKDNDFNAPGFPIVDYDDFTVVDLSATFRLTPRHAVDLAVNNLFDAYYYEKLGYPLQGASFTISYRLDVSR